MSEHEDARICACGQPCDEPACPCCGGEQCNACCYRDHAAPEAKARDAEIARLRREVEARRRGSAEDADAHADTMELADDLRRRLVAAQKLCAAAAGIDPEDPQAAFKLVAWRRLYDSDLHAASKGKP